MWLGCTEADILVGQAINELMTPPSKQESFDDQKPNLLHFTKEPKKDREDFQLCFWSGCGNFGVLPSIKVSPPASQGSTRSAADLKKGDLDSQSETAPTLTHLADAPAHVVSLSWDIPVWQHEVSGEKGQPCSCPGYWLMSSACWWGTSTLTALLFAHGIYIYNRDFTEKLEALLSLGKMTNQKVEMWTKDLGNNYFLYLNWIHSWRWGDWLAVLLVTRWAGGLTATY